MLTLRPAVAADVPTILALIRALATYEKEPDAVVATEASLLRDGFGERPAVPGDDGRAGTGIRWASPSGS